MKSLALFAALFAASSFATTKPVEPTPTPTTSESVSGAAAVAGAAAVGVGVGHGGKGGAGGKGGNGRATADANNAITTDDDVGVEVSSDDDTVITYPRQVPPVLLPTLIVSDCGTGGSVGGADKGAAGAVSALFTPQRCYALRAAAMSFAVGDYEGGCKRLAYVTRKIDKEMQYTPDCKEFAERLNKEAEARSKQTAIDTSKFVTRDEQNERDRRLIETVSRK